MHNLKFLLQKEFRQIFRNPTILRLIIAMPMVQLIVIPFAADYEVKNINLGVIDQDHSVYAQRIIQKLDASQYFTLKTYTGSYTDVEQKIDRGAIDIIVQIPQNFEKNLIRDSRAAIFLAADAVNGVKAGLGTAYASAIIQDFNQEIRQEWHPGPPPTSYSQIRVETSQWYNPHTNYHWFMVPGILAILVTMVGSFLAAMNIVAEKESGTIEQINVSPIKKHEFILGKLIPFWILGLVSIAIGMIVAVIVYGLWPVGSILTIFGFSGIYLVAVLGIGLLVSTMVENQQQATLFAFFFMMIFILMGGLYTPVDSMPEWAKIIAELNPPMYFIRAIRAIYLKGSGFADLKEEIVFTLGFALFFNILAIWNYRKRSA